MDFVEDLKRVNAMMQEYPNLVDFIEEDQELLAGALSHMIGLATMQAAFPDDPEIRMQIVIQQSIVLGYAYTLGWFAGGADRSSSDPNLDIFADAVG